MKNFRHNQQGIAHIIILVLALIVIGAVAGVGYEVMSKARTSSNSTTSTTAVKTNTAIDSKCLATYHDNNLCRFSTNASALNNSSYVASLTIESPSGETSTIALKNDGKGNTELTTTGGGQTFNTISLNGNSYIQTGGSSTWTEYPAGVQSPTLQVNPSSKLDLATDTPNLTFKAIGKSACGSLSCYKYQLTDSSTPDKTQYILFDNHSYLLREWQASDSTTGKVDMKMNYQAVNITAPSPVQVFKTTN